MEKISLVKFYWIRVFVSIIFMTCFCVIFGKTLFLIPFHAVVAFSLFSLEFLVVWYFWNFIFASKFNLLRGVILIIPSITSSVLFFLYLLDIVGNKLWLKNINFSYVLYLLQNTKSFQADTGVSFAVVIFIYFFLFSVSYLAHVFFVEYSNIKASDLLLDIKTVSFAGVFFIIVFLLLAIFNIRELLENNYYDQEPVISFLKESFQSSKSNNGILYSQRMQYIDSIDVNNVKKKNVVVIFMDSARADNFPMYGYGRETTPFLSKLYAQGKLVKVDYAFSGCSESLCGMLSFDASKGYNNLSVATASQSEILIQEILKKVGYDNYFLGGMETSGSWEMSLSESNSRDFYKVIDGYTKFSDSDIKTAKESIKKNNFSTVFPLIENDKVVPGRVDDRRVLIGLNNVPDYKDKTSLFIFWLMSSHQGGRKEINFNVFNPTIDKVDAVAYVTGQLPRDVLANRYDNGLVQTDYYISKIFELLQKKGYLDNSIVFILGDHGESLGEKGYYGHLSNLYNEQMRIPLLIYSSDKIDIKNKDYATQTDVSATILDVLNIKAPIWWQGISLVGNVPKVSSTHELADNVGGERVLIYKKGEKLYKYFYFGSDYYFSDGSEQKLYELTSDPNENNDIIKLIDGNIKKEITEEFIKKFKMAVKK